jgi:3-dehydroquinate dehydratase/shikimate dehydrogenase
MTLACVSLTAKDINGLARAARAARARGADVVELRLDHLERPALEELAELRSSIDFIPVIATLRPKREGGSFRGSEGSRIKMLEQIIGLGFDYLDLELVIGPARRARLLRLCRDGGVKSIVSYHDTAGTPGVGRMFRKLARCAAEGDIGKAAFAARSYRDTCRIMVAARRAREKKLVFIAIGMGGPGKLTRTLAPFIGSALAYASLDGRKMTADGQLDIRALKRLWGASGVGKSVTPSTALYGLIGRPLGHSLSPLMHTTAFRSLDIDAAYMPFEVEERSLGGTILALRAIGLRGANVTIPYKERIMQYIDGMDDAAQSIGAVNTILNKDGELVGYNTDVSGLIDALKAAGVRLDGADALVIGAGGAARAAVYGLLRHNARVTVAGRTKSRALALRRHLGAPGIGLVDLKAVKSAMEHANLVINCTPVGMRGFRSRAVVPAEHLRRDMAVMDMVYNPVRTPLLSAAERKGAKTISGMEMFIRQGMASFRIWTGRSFPLDKIRRALADSQNR